MVPIYYPVLTRAAVLVERGSCQLVHSFQVDSKPRKLVAVGHPRGESHRAAVSVAIRDALSLPRAEMVYRQMIRGVTAKRDVHGVKWSNTGLLAYMVK